MVELKYIIRKKGGTENENNYGKNEINKYWKKRKKSGIKLIARNFLTRLPLKSK